MPEMKYKKITIGFVVQDYETFGGKHICVGQEFIAGEVNYVDDEDNEVDVDTTEEQYQPLEMKQPHITRTEGGLTFNCPACKGHRLECCEDGAYVSEVLHIDEEGDFDYGEIIASGMVERFQCLNCGYTLEFEDESGKYIATATHNEEVVEWIKKNCK